ncbi:MAG: hypothetical protein AAF628_23630 [Planctomycetota bacterium]
MSAHDLSSYDAADLAIAMDHGLPLATSDERLVAAARHEGVVLFAV